MVDIDQAAALYNRIKNIDPVDVAEQLTNNQEEKEGLTLGLMAKLSADKRFLLSEMGDTHMSSSMEEAMKVLMDLGFNVIYRESFLSDNYVEVYYILWNPMGLLATLESYSGNHMNTLRVYGNWVPDDGDYYAGIYYSGHHFIREKFHEDGRVDLDSPVLASAFSLDGREGIKHMLSIYATKGKFLQNWLGVPFVWLCNYHETKDRNYNFENIGRKKFNQFPEEVKQAMLSKNIAKTDLFDL